MLQPQVKPLIQDANTTEKPYHLDAKISHDLAHPKSAVSSAVATFDEDAHENESMSTALGGKTKRVSNVSMTKRT